jgi:hypothetical protein
VHLLVRPDLPLYADVNYSKKLEDILAFAVGLPPQDVISAVGYNTIDPDESPITHTKSSTQFTAAYAIIAAAHHDLMQTHKFIIPATATQEHILFDALTPGKDSQHLDYIAAVCDVRYNWVFDPKRAPGYDAGQLTPAATYHDIDVHRHITHLQSSSATRSDLLKKLSTGWHVNEIGGTKRRGVIVFDVQEHGRFQKHFRGRADPQQLCHDACELFGTNNKTSDKHIADAMRAYFTPEAQWSLCDMAYKYVIYDTASPPAQPTYFMRDSFELQRDHMNSDSASACSFCPFCPVCFEAQPDTLGAGGTTMYHHIKT